MSMSPSKPDSQAHKLKSILKWALTGLPLGGVVWASFLPLQSWMQQALVLVTLVWFMVFLLLDTFFLGG
jgi:thiol:disulfide interchange protein